MKPSCPTTPESRVYSSKLLDRRWLTEKVFEIELSKPASFQFMAGHRIQLLRGDMQRDYSLITGPADSTLALCVYNLAGGRFSPVLASAPVGSSLSFTGPHGYFTYRPSARQAVFVATGTGIAPFLSMVRSGITGFTLLHGVRTPKELYYQDDFRRTARLYVPCLSATFSAKGAPDTGFRGRVIQYLEEHLPLGEYDFYLCGGQKMIRDVLFLVDTRFPGSLVYTEIFY